jgi:hypothetical protein
MLFHPNSTRYLELFNDHHGQALSRYDHRGYSLQQLAVNQRKGEMSYTIVTLEDIIPVTFINNAYTYTLDNAVHAWTRQDSGWRLAKNTDTVAYFAITGSNATLTTVPPERPLTDLIEATTALKLLQ